jgi:formylglycine-generating enzyme required for sulfatase activity
MGSPGNELGRNDHDETQHTVTLTKPFYMGIYEITQAQYQNVMGSNPSYFKAGAHAPKRPVEQVLWDMVRGGGWPGGSPADTTFMGKLRSKTGHAFDLPTEAQWEYACRAGTTKALNNNTALKDTEQDPNMDILGRYWDNGGRLWRSDGVNGAHTTVGSYQANNWGLYDMHGNVWEWCLDWYDWRSYDGDATDPTGPPSGSYRVKRGGGWSSDARWCRSACKFEYSPDMTYNDIGFRLVLPIGQ